MRTPSAVRTIAVRLRAVAFVVAATALPGCPADPAGAPSGPAPAVLIPPLHDAEAGEELRLRRGAEDWVWRITSTTTAAIEVEFTVRRTDGLPSPAPSRLVWARNAFGVPPEFIVRMVRRDRISVGGRDWDCWAIRAHSESEIRYWWVTDELPCHGVLRMAIDRDGSPDLSSAADCVPEESRFPAR